MFQSIYQLPLSEIILLTILLPTVWGIIAAFVQKKGFGRIWCLLNVLFALLCIYLICRLTFLRRESGGVYRVVLQPFVKLRAAASNPELYREMLMNVFLFVPFGMSSFFALRSEQKSLLAGLRAVLLTIIAGCIVSVGVETLQYMCARGNAEISDVICNSLGAAAGTWAGGAARIVTYFLHKYREQNGAARENSIE